MNALPTILRRTALAATIALTLTACGGSIADEVAAQQRFVSAPTLPDVPGAQPDITDEYEPEPTTAAPTTTEPAVPTSEVNARGNIVKTLGEEGGLFAEDGTALYTFAIDAITPDVECTEDYSYDPENGHLTAVQMRVSTGAVSPDELGYLSVSSYDFQFIGADGLTFTNVSTIATYSCVDPSSEFPGSQLAPGSQYAGVVLLDLPAANGTLIYQPSISYDGGWEISY